MKPSAIIAANVDLDSLAADDLEYNYDVQGLAGMCVGPSSCVLPVSVSGSAPTGGLLAFEHLSSFQLVVRPTTLGILALRSENAGQAITTAGRCSRGPSFLAACGTYQAVAIMESPTFQRVNHH